VGGTADEAGVSASSGGRGTKLVNSAPCKCQLWHSTRHALNTLQTCVRQGCSNPSANLRECQTICIKRIFDTVGPDELVTSELLHSPCAVCPCVCFSRAIAIHSFIRPITIIIERVHRHGGALSSPPLPSNIHTVKLFQTGNSRTSRTHQ